ncbi:Uncharacterised protein [Vibrio cholerae]|nr:Uncharacterised protein [Vibrio cholerae]
MVALSDMMRPIFFPQSFNLIVVVQIKLTVFKYFSGSAKNASRFC